MSDEKKTGDILGIAPYGEAINTLSKGVVAGASAFLSRICLPAAEEFGLLLRDKVCSWRSRNATGILLKAEQLLGAEPNSGGMHAHPRLVANILENGSWTDDDPMQQLWAGLLATSCSEDGRDESNLIFVNLLKQLTSLEAHLIDCACSRAQKVLTLHGLIFSLPLICTTEELFEMANLRDVNRLDRELDHLRALGLLALEGGFPAYSPVPIIACLTPSPLALQLFARCKGYRGTPQEYFGITFTPAAAAAISQ